MKRRTASKVQKMLKWVAGGLLASTAALYVSQLGTAAQTFEYLVSLGQQKYLDDIRSRGEIVFVTRNTPSTYYQGRNGPEGLEFDLAMAYAAHLGVRAKFLLKDTVSDVLDAVEHDKVHIANAGLTSTVERERQFLFAPAYQEIRQQVVCRRDGRSPDSFTQLGQIDLWVPVETSYVEMLQTLKNNFVGVGWTETGLHDTEQLLVKVWQKEVDCTVADSNIALMNQRYFPELKVSFDLSGPQFLRWALPADAYDLQRDLDLWFAKIKESKELNRIIDRYYGHIDSFDYVDTQRYKQRIRKRLPQYRKWFLAAAVKYDLDWALLAAQAYQESHWDPRAKSPTGVRGMMMLTLVTAKDMGLKSRLNARNSIFAGAKYMARLRRALPVEIDEPDRTWFALAAYNVGLGHVLDARQLAVDMGMNPNDWHEVEEILPLLSNKAYYKKTKYGYARGEEPVMYVQRIRNYKNILDKALDLEEDKRNTRPGMIAKN